MKNSTACTPSKCRTVGVDAGESEQLTPRGCSLFPATDYFSLHFNPTK